MKSEYSSDLVLASLIVLIGDYGTDWLYFLNYPPYWHVGDVLIETKEVFMTPTYWPDP